uniref:GH18 domain-containing protein n=1 Tax=Tetranychus urticae TaxID=32264 RepID=T1JYG3_TETUR
MALFFDEVCKFWLKQKISVRKLILGVPTFARTFNLAYPFGQGFNSPSVGPGLGKGQLNYTKVCEFLSDGGISEFDEKGMVPFAHRNYDWISYENERSLSIKSRYAASRKMGGVMTYALNYDDWTGTCRDSKSFPLLRAVSSTLKLAQMSTFKN